LSLVRLLTYYNILGEWQNMSVLLPCLQGAGFSYLTIADRVILSGPLMVLSSSSEWDNLGVVLHRFLRFFRLREELSVLQREASRVDQWINLLGSELERRGMSSITLIQLALAQTLKDF
jgi:hypothetical protein